VKEFRPRRQDFDEGRQRHVKGETVTTTAAMRLIGLVVFLVGAVSLIRQSSVEATRVSRRPNRN